jgi:hypothetical protein
LERQHSGACGKLQQLLTAHATATAPKRLRIASLGNTMQLFTEQLNGMVSMAATAANT